VGEDKAKAISDAVVKRLTEIRVQRGLSQNQLSKEAGLSRGAIRFVEAGETHPTFYTLLKISRVLRVDLGRITTEETRKLYPLRKRRLNSL
jgi:transcriptional regulator with XRE-family HTH domain